MLGASLLSILQELLIVCQGLQGRVSSGLHGSAVGVERELRHAKQPCPRHVRLWVQTLSRPSRKSGLLTVG